MCNTGRGIHTKTCFRDVTTRMQCVRQRQRDNAAKGWSYARRSTVRDTGGSSTAGVSGIGDDESGEIVNMGNSTVDSTSTGSGLARAGAGADNDDNNRASES